MSGKQTRRRLLQAAGIGAGALLVDAHGCLGQTQPLNEKKRGRRKPAGERQFKLGLASYTTRKLSLDETLTITQRLGLKYICLKSFHLPLESTPAEIAAVAAKVKQAGIELYGGGVIRMKSEDEVNQAFEYARAAGMEVIVGVPEPEVLGLVNEKVQEYDIKVAIHNHGPTDKLYPTPDVTYEKIKNLDRRIGICHDIGHTQRTGMDPSKATAKCAERLLDVHMKDVDAAKAEGKTVEIGRGVIDIPKFIRTLFKIKYAGVVSFEYEKDAEDPLAGLAESVGYVRGVLAALD